MPLDELTKAQLQPLVKSRSITLGAMTKMKKFIEEYGKAAHFHELETRLGLLEQYFTSLCSIQSEIDLLLEEDDGKRDTFTENYIFIKSKMRQLIEKARPHVCSENLNITSDTTIPHQGQVKQRSARLPKIELTTFSGKYTEWIDFKNMFDAFVHTSDSFIEIEKFQYLRSHLSGRPFKLITSMEITALNYNTAYKMLHDRYDNKRLIFQAHIREILEINRVSKSAVDQLRDVTDTVNAHLRALEAMGTKAQLADGFLIQSVLSKLDKSSQEKWEIEYKSKDIPTWANFLEIIESNFQAMENVESTHNIYAPASTSSAKNKSYPKQQKQNTFLTSEKSDVCKLCSEIGHSIWNCVQFKLLNPVQRFAEAKRLNICINCLREGHRVKRCKSEKCSLCPGKHNTLLHMQTSGTQAQSQSSSNVTSFATTLQSTQPEYKLQSISFNHQSNPRTSETQPSTSNKPSLSSQSSTLPKLSGETFLSTFDNQYVFLGTAIVRVQKADGSVISCRALLDSCSQFHLCSRDLIKKLHIHESSCDSSIAGVGDISAKSSKIAKITIGSMFNNYNREIQVAVMSNITNHQPSCHINIDAWNIPKNINLADSEFNKPQAIDLLIGTELFYGLLSIGQINLGNNLPILQKTLLGWIVVGKTLKRTPGSILITTNNEENFESDDLPIDALIERFWKIDSIESTIEKLTPEEKCCEEHFVNNVKRTSEGRFIIRLPFKESPDRLGNSFESAKQRFFNLEKRLIKSPELRKEYSKFIEEYIELNHMSLINSNIHNEMNYFIPHHCVLKPSSTTTRLRVVFDASNKSSSGKSLNNILMVGPILQEDLFSILLRFRSYIYVMTADVSKMYRQVMVAPEDRNFQCILWRFHQADDLQMFRLNTVTYGTSSASYQSIRCLFELAKIERMNLKKGAEIVERDFYVDDMVTGANSFPELLQIYNETTELLSKGGFILRKFCSNSRELMKLIDDSDKETLSSFEDCEFIRTLGLMYDPTDDFFIFSHTPDENKKPVTKRIVASSIARLFDPLGLLNPIIVSAKILMQHLWKLKLNWDESLPADIHSQWVNFREQFKNIHNVKISRRVIMPFYAKIELHIFSDASMSAYGSCAYIRCVDNMGNTSCHLLCAKSRVAPVKTISLPRLELCGALCSAELMQKILKALKLKFDSIIFWTDSTIVLAWLSSIPCKLSIFVSNRVAKVQSITEGCQWLYIPTASNPADLVSRGCLPNDIIDSQFWFNGPEFLQASIVEWPEQPNQVIENMPEMKLQKFIMMTTAAIETEDYISTSKHANSFILLRNTYAHIFRLMQNRKLTKNNRSYGQLTPIEMQQGEYLIIKMIQKVYFSSEYHALQSNNNLNKKSPLLSLTPFLDDDGILRVGGRLQNSSLDNDSQHQILLPKRHPFTIALIHHYHFKYLHMGPKALLSQLRQRYWVINGREAVVKVVRSCLRCARMRPKFINQLMGSLPASRVNITEPLRPFVKTGIDLCGPFHVRDGFRGKRTVKMYIALFICFCTKAIHLEIVMDLSTNEFLAALKRFIARRGRPLVIYSDNATNFVGCNNVLVNWKNLFMADEHQSELNQFCGTEGFKWEFIPPRSPHFAGLWESSIKIAKHHLLRIMGNSSLVFNELFTLVCQIEAVMNSRPIEPLSSDPNDVCALTPGHFIIGAPLTAIVEPNVTEININRLTRWERIRSLYQQFWNRWTVDYLHTLQQRAKWTTKSRNISIGTLVLIKNENLPPLQWLLGRIVAIHPGSDGLVRVVSIKTKNGIISRAITKIAPLPAELQPHDDTADEN